MSESAGVPVNRIFSTSKVANANLFTDFLQPSDSKYVHEFRIFCCFSADVTVTLVLNNGQTEETGDFNDVNDTTVPAGKAYEFYHEVRPGDQVNYRISANATVKWFYVTEFRSSR